MKFLNANIFSLKLMILVILINTTVCFGQVNPIGIDNTFIGLDRENGVIIMSGIAIASYFLTKKTSKNYRLDYYQAHIAYFNGDGYDVFMQNFGLEREYSSWFSLRVEGNIQEFNKENYNTFGIGIKLYCRYSLFGKKKISPYFEYGRNI